MDRRSTATLICDGASLIVATNKPFGSLGEVSADDVAAAMIDRLAHHDIVIDLRGNSRRRVRPSMPSATGLRFSGGTLTTKTTSLLTDQRQRDEDRSRPT